MTKWAMVFGMLTLFAGSAFPASADPAKSPYPDISRYAKLDFEAFRLGQDNDNVWFRSPSGLNCGIWGDGSFGCTGSIPGAPAGTNQIGSFPEDDQPHFDSTQQPRFVNPNGLPQRVLPRDRYIRLGETVCAVTDNDSVYCSGKSPSTYPYDRNQFLVGPASTYLGSAT